MFKTQSGRDVFTRREKESERVLKGEETRIHTAGHCVQNTKGNRAAHMQQFGL